MARAAGREPVPPPAPSRALGLFGIARTDVSPATHHLARWAADERPARSGRELSLAPSLLWEGNGEVSVKSSPWCPWPRQHFSGSWHRSGFSLSVPPALCRESLAFLLLPPLQRGLGSACRAAPWK